MASVKKPKALSVVSVNENFRRAGYSFGRKATIIPLSELNKEQVELIKDEPMLVVSEVDIDGAAEEKEAE
jgi:hypothetical protein